MSTLREAIHEYIEMRRHPGFKLKQDCRLLHQFARFMEQHEKPFITVELAVRWAQQPHNAQPAWWAKRLSAVRVFAAIARRSIRALKFRLANCWHLNPGGQSPICIQINRSATFCRLHGRCPARMNELLYGHGFIIAFSVCLPSLE